MTIQYQYVEIPLQGLAESSTPIARPMGKMDIAENVEIRETEGSLAFCKTRGYRFVPMDNAVGRYDIDVLFTRVVNFAGRLVVFSYDYVTELGDRAEGMRGGPGLGDSVVYRGPSNRGNIKMRIVAVARSSASEPDPG